MRYEIQKHWARLIKISKLPDEQLQISFTQVISKIKFISEEIIPQDIWVAAEGIAKGIDIDDTDFIAMTMFLKANLWTGDMVLYRGLKKLDFKKILNTSEMLELRNTKKFKKYGI
jgi:predicted nucleic acid-binding protein